MTRPGSARLGAGSAADAAPADARRYRRHLDGARSGDGRVKWLCLAPAPRQEEPPREKAWTKLESVRPAPQRLRRRGRIPARHPRQGRDAAEAGRLLSKLLPAARWPGAAPWGMTRDSAAVVSFLARSQQWPGPYVWAEEAVRQAGVARCCCLRGQATRAALSEGQSPVPRVHVVSKPAVEIGSDGLHWQDGGGPAGRVARRVPSGTSGDSPGRQVSAGPPSVGTTR